MKDPFDRPARPWDIFNKNLEKVMPAVQKERMDICNACPFLIKATKQCMKCGCFMAVKTRLPNATCPEGKWGIIEVSFTEEKE
jgi:hypothetical protein